MKFSDCNVSVGQWIGLHVFGFGNSSGACELFYEMSNDGTLTRDPILRGLCRSRELI